MERLESGGITALFYSLVGKGEEKLTEERREAAGRCAQIRECGARVGLRHVGHRRLRV